jgi:hypothetical protein
VNYQKALEIFESAKNKASGKPIANNTRIVKRDNALAIRLHETDVLTIHPDNSVTYNTGGWKTVTTKERLNSYGPARIYSNRGTWLLSVAGKEYVFADGLTISADGNVSGAGELSDKANEAKLRKAAGNYAKAFVDALFEGKIGKPGAGDCFYCGMHEVQTGKPLGELNRDASHIQTHLEEGYFVPSLLVNAMEMFGASIAAKQTAWAFMSGETQHAFSKDRGSFIAAQIQKIIRRYVQRQLGIAA